MAVAETPPLLEGFDPFDPEHLRDPYAIYARALVERPVFYYPPLRFWMVTRHADVTAVLGDVGTFSSRVWRAVPPPPELADRVPANPMAEAFINLDPPEHTVSRKAANRAFTRGLVARLEPDIRRGAEKLVEGFAATGHCDLMQDFCLPLSLGTITDLLGLPEEDKPRFRRWTEDMFSLMSPAAPDDPSTSKPMPADEVARRYEGIAEAFEYYQAVIDARRREPREDLVSVLVALRDEDGRPAISDGRIVTHMLELTAAGHDTTANAIANTVEFLAGDPSAQEAVSGDRELLEGAVEESLRMRATSPTMFRITTREVELGGVTIPAAAVLCVNLGAANRDPERFGCPAHFDAGREDSDAHLAFGRGRHFCLGAPLARLETRVALEVLLGRLGPLAVTPGQDQEYLPLITLDSRLHLEVSW
jgi:cytochrome P450